MLSSPITHHESLEVKFIFQQSIEYFRVLARVCVVDLIVRTHNTPHPRADSFRKRPKVQFVHRPIIEIGCYTWKIREPGSISRLSEMFLFVEDVVLCCGDDACVLQTQDRLFHCPASQVWIWREALPISTINFCTSALHRG